MKLSIVTGVCGRNEVTRRWLDSTIANCSQPHELIIVSNGSTDEEDLQLDKWLDELSSEGWKTFKVESADPLGSTIALNLGIEHATGEIIAMLHNDLLVKDKGWDTQLIDFYENTPNAGLVGFAGAKGLGSADIYSTPYVLVQLARNTVYTSLHDWQNHGMQCVEPTKILVLDGLTICAKKEDLVRLGGFDEQYVHHMYDNDISLTFAYAGLDNYVIPVLCEHLNGQTANFATYNEWVKKTHTEDADSGIHRISHQLFYDKWIGKLPARVA